MPRQSGDLTIDQLRSLRESSPAFARAHDAAERVAAQMAENRARYERAPLRLVKADPYTLVMQDDPPNMPWQWGKPA